MHFADLKGKICTESTENKTGLMYGVFLTEKKTPEICFDPTKTIFKDHSRKTANPGVFFMISYMFCI